MNKVLKSMFAAALATVLVQGAWAAPTIFTSTGQSTTVTYSSGINAATVGYQLTALGASTATFAVAINNSGSSILGGFGIIDLVPNLTAVTDPNATWDAFVNANFNGGASMELCVRGAGSCNANSSTGLGAGLTDAFSITLTFAAPTNGQVSFEGFLARFSTAGSNNNVIVGGTASALTQGRIPEPGSLALAGLALVGLAACRRARA